jgi:hypothetical protein
VIDERGIHWRIPVSTEPPSRDDVTELEVNARVATVAGNSVALSNCIGPLHLPQDKLIAALKLKQARPAPLCPVREEVFAGAFDELLRQVALECPERGLLLLRVRDEIRMTLAAYNTMVSYHTTLGAGVPVESAAVSEVRLSFPAVKGSLMDFPVSQALVAEESRKQALLNEITRLEACVQVVSGFVSSSA